MIHHGQNIETNSFFLGFILALYHLHRRSKLPQGPRHVLESTEYIQSQYNLPPATSQPLIPQPVQVPHPPQVAAYTRATIIYSTSTCTISPSITTATLNLPFPIFR